MVPSRLVQEAIEDILSHVRTELDTIAVSGDEVRRVDVASHLHIADRTAAYNLLRQRLRMRYKPSTQRWVRASDGQRYVELLYVSDGHMSLAMVERRVHSRGFEPTFCQACVLVTAGNAFIRRRGFLGRNPHLTPSLALSSSLESMAWPTPHDFGPLVKGDVRDEKFDKRPAPRYTSPPARPASTYSRSLRRVKPTSRTANYVVVAAFVGLIAVGLAAWVVVKHIHSRNNVQAGVPSTLAWTADRAPGIGPDNFSSPVDGAGLFPSVLYETIKGDTIRTIDTDLGSELFVSTPPDGDNTVTSDPASYPGQLVLGSNGQAFFAIDVKTGRLQWQQPWPNGDPGLGPQISGGVAAVSDHGQIFAYNATTGKHVWTSVQGADQLAFDHPEDFTLVSGTAFLLTAHNLAAYNADNGRLKWLVPVVYAADPLGAQQLGGVVQGRIIVAGDSWIEAFSTRSGRELWRDSLPNSGPKWPLVSSQVVVANICEAIGCGVGQMLGFNPVNGKQLWSLPTAGQWNFEEPPGEWLGSGTLLQWQPGSDTDNTIIEIQPNTGTTLKTWNINGTMPQYVLADSAKLYIVNYDSSVVAVHR